ncbi:MAG: DUF3224 domain-containing protein [Cellvibrionaceae bacterium]
MNITGEFEVKLQPQETYAEGKDGIQLGRMSINKTFKGDLNAVSQGEMLNAMTTTQGSAGYVAIEQVKGILSGKAGSFVLQHYGIMNKGQDRLVLEVVPDSGSEELVGLSGEMKIIIKDGKHFYEFDFSL